MSRVFSSNDCSTFEKAVCRCKIVISRIDTRIHGNTFAAAVQTRGPYGRIAPATPRWLCPRLPRLRCLATAPRSFPLVSCSAVCFKQVLGTTELFDVQFTASSRSLESRNALAIPTHFSHFARLSLIARASMVFFQNVDLPKTTWYKQENIRISALHVAAVGR